MVAIVEPGVEATHARGEGEPTHTLVSLLDDCNLVSTHARN
jgi:hypothetical protein